MNNLNKLITFDQQVEIQYLFEILDNIKLPILLTEKKYPYQVLYVNENWINECEYKFNEIVGNTCKIMQGPMSCKYKLKLMNDSIKNNNKTHVSIINYTKNRKPFLNKIYIDKINIDYNLDLFICICQTKFLFDNDNDNKEIFKINLKELEKNILNLESIYHNYKLNQNIKKDIINFLNDFYIILNNNKYNYNNKLINLLNYKNYDYNKLHYK